MTVKNFDLSTRTRRGSPPSRRDEHRPGLRARGLSANDRIDLCRGIFAFLVVIAHAFEVTCGIHDPSRQHVSRQALDLIWGTAGTGIFYVMGFFVISGYCIHLSVARLMEAERFPIKVYLVARLSRILPLYYAALLFTMIVELLIAPARPQAWPNGLNPSVLISQFFVVQNLTQTYGSFAPSWSITNELIYYAIYGLLACFAMKRIELPAKVGMIWCLGTAALMQTLYVTTARTPVILSLGMLSGLGINWFLGTLVAAHAESLKRSPTARVASRAWLPLLAVAVWWNYQGKLPQQGVFLISGLAFTLMLIRFLNAEGPGLPPVKPRWLEMSITWLGLSSYPTYLFHGPILMLVGSAILRWGLIPDWRATWAVLSVSGISWGIALGLLAERPIMDWRSVMLRRLKAAHQGSPRKTPASVVSIQG
ncbi:MAG: acyltransferase [Planctomycetaceae bacterium]|nr:acyltransferase [Planctomycetaceae bacterium]